MSRKIYLFAAVSLALLIAFASSIWKQQRRPWKTYQRIYQKEKSALETERLRRMGTPRDQIARRIKAIQKEPLKIREIQPPKWGVVERCLTCHQGIKEISTSHPINSFGCTVCHGGNGLAVTKKEAHAGLLGGSNPSDLRVVERTCGRKAPDGTACHQGRSQSWENQVDRVQKTLMATMAGVITGIRFSWRAQDDYRAHFASVGVSDLDGEIPAERGALHSLKTIPVYSLRELQGSSKEKPVLDPLGRPLTESREYADDQWRKFCSRCHLWNRRPYGSSGHSGGCASCHCLHNDSSTYQGSDPTIPRNKSGYAMTHRITTHIPTSQCARCHNRSGRIGLSYQGLMESDRYGTPFQGGTFNKTRLSALRSALHMVPDIHFEKGMHCIDCHTSRDIMGEGNIYSRMKEQVEIRCRDCHGTATNPPNKMIVRNGSEYPVWASQMFPWWSVKPGDEVAVSSRGRPLINVIHELKGWVLHGKVNGKTHPVEIITGKPGPHAMPGHEKLECSACHSSWAPQCYGCHDYRFKGEKQLDSNTGISTAGRWRETRGYYRFEDPQLGIDDRGRVSPYMPGCQVLFSELNEKGKPILPYKNYVFKGGHLLSGILSVPIDPHTTRRRVRPCQSCHLNPKAMGIGVGFVSWGEKWPENGFLPIHDSLREGLPFSFAMESPVDSTGHALQGTSHYRARPFNKEELKRILRVGTCLPCHDRYNDPIYQDWQASLKKNFSDAHLQAIHRSIKATGEEGWRYEEH